MNVSSTKLAFIGIMTAACVSSNYLMIGLVNIKFMDLFVFISGYVMGGLSGASVGVLTWLVYGTFNPLGFNLLTLASTCLGESLYGLVGGLSARFGLLASASHGTASGEDFFASNFKIGIVGFLLTFVYDLFTNIVSGVSVGISPFVAIVAGIPFAVAHEGSNFFFFFLGGNVLIRAIQKVTFGGGEKLRYREVAGCGSQ